MRKLLLILFIIPLFGSYEYAEQDYNSTSPTYGSDVWLPEYEDHITLHYFSSQGWGGWTSTFGQLSNFQNELRNDDGYENVVIIAVGQSNISGFNNSFCSNSDLPLVMDQYPSLPIRDMFSPHGLHKQVVILGYDGELLGYITLNSGLNNSAKNYIRGILEEHYEQSILGDINGDTLINIQDVVVCVNIVLGFAPEVSTADMNGDGAINVQDIITLINIILN